MRGRLRAWARSWEQPPAWLERPIIVWLRNPYVQMRLGKEIVQWCFLAWLVSQVTNQLFGTEPPQILALSWWAVLLTGLSLIILVDVGEVVKPTEEE